MKALALAGLLLGFLCVAANAQETEIGMVKTAKGKAYILGASGRADAGIGTVVRRNDMLETGDDGALGVTFIDNTTISLGPKSQITLTSYVFEPRSGKFAFVADMTRGTLMFISGLITKLSPDAVSLHTPVGTLGVRGTRFLVDLGQ